MTDDPRRIDPATIETGRRALERLRSGEIPDELEHDDEPGAAATVAEHRAARWRQVCPQRFHRASLEWTAGQHGPDVVGALCDWSAMSPRPNLLILGPVGTGKTGAALSVCARDWFDAGLAVQFWPVVELLDGLRPDGDADMDDMMDVPRLILDDLGAEKPSEWTAERLYVLVNRRWLEERPIVATSNLPATTSTAPPGYVGDVLEDRIGERLFSRLVGDEAVVVNLAGRDRRRG